MLPALLLATLIFSTCFMTLFEKGEAEDRQRIEDIYDNTRVFIEALPTGDEETLLRMNTYRGDVAAALPEIADSYVMLELLYTPCEPEVDLGASTVYGTNNPEAMAEYENFNLTWGEGWDRERFLNTEDETACLIFERLAEQLGVGLGDTFVITSSHTENERAENAPRRTLTVAGFLSGNQCDLTEYDIVVPRSIFSGTDGLAYDYLLKYQYFYRSYRLELKREYNRDIDAVVAKVEDALIDDYVLLTNSRTITQAIRPIERKLQLQAMLQPPLVVVFCVATAVLALLLALSLKTEAFLRFLMGQGRWSVFAKLFGSILLVLAIFAVLALGVTWLAAGTAWLPQAAKYLGLSLALALVATGAPLARTCSKNLVKLYQEREG